MKELSIDDICFPVKDEKIFLKSGDKYKVASSYRAILNSDSGALISVVSKFYKLIPNTKAYEYGIKCMRELFELHKEDEIKVFNIISPKLLSFCHIDLVCNNRDFTIIKDNYMQFVRVTNSYNTTYKLRFSVGFCRSICKNGNIFDSNSIEFNFCHTKKENTENINFKIKKEEFQTLKKKFVRNIEYLNEIKIDSRYLFALFCKALDIKFNLNGNSTALQKELAHEKLDNYQSYFYKKYEEYSKELGDNLYSLYNVITDFSSNPIEINSFYTNTYNSNQRRAGKWLFDFTEMHKEGLNIEDYLKDYLYLKRN